MCSSSQNSPMASGGRRWTRSWFQKSNPKSWFFLDFFLMCHVLHPIPHSLIFQMCWHHQFMARDFFFGIVRPQCNLRRGCRKIIEYLPQNQPSEPWMGKYFHSQTRFFIAYIEFILFVSCCISAKPLPRWKWIATATVGRSVVTLAAVNCAIPTLRGFEQAGKAVLFQLIWRSSLLRWDWPLLMALKRSLSTSTRVERTLGIVTMSSSRPVTLHHPTRLNLPTQYLFHKTKKQERVDTRLRHRHQRKVELGSKCWHSPWAKPFLSRKLWNEFEFFGAVADGHLRTPDNTALRPMLAGIESSKLKSSNSGVWDSEAWAFRVIVPRRPKSSKLPSVGLTCAIYHVCIFSFHSFSMFSLHVMNVL